MELRAQEADAITPVSLGFAQFARESPSSLGGSGEVVRGARREGSSSHNGASILGATGAQTLDHPHPTSTLQQRPSFHIHPKPEREDSNPDPVSFAFSGSLTPVAAGSKPKPTVRYRECLRNHAASVGGSVYDGCGEFMPSGNDGSAASLKCAACECHRNFHRKEVDGEAQISSNFRRGLVTPLQLPPPPLPSPYQRYPVGAVHSPMVTPMSVAYGGVSGAAGGGNESSSEDLNVFSADPHHHHHHHHHHAAGGSGSMPFSKKRFRTKFTAEQKEKMMEFAEKVGWRIQKQNEDEVERFCEEVGVRRQVLKVWMHNNKNNNVKKQQSEAEPA